MKEALREPEGIRLVHEGDLEQKENALASAIVQGMPDPKGTFMLMLLLAVAAGSPAIEYRSLSSIPGSVLVRECAGDAVSTDRGLVMDLCNAYILGVADTLQANRLTCRSHSDAASLQSVGVVRKYIKDHPERWNAHPAIMVQEALQQAFPCQR